MKTLFVITVVALLAAFVFWEVLSAILGGVAIMALILVVLLGVAAFAGYQAFGKLKHRVEDKIGHM